MRKYTYNEQFFKTINTTRKAYWLGFILGDGNVYSGTHSHLLIKLQHRDENHLQKFLKDINATYPIRQVRAGAGSFAPNNLYSQIQINGKKIVTDLIKYGIVPRKSLKTYFPKQIQEKFKRHFIRGVFDADGCFHTRPSQGNGFVSVVAFTGNKILLLEIQKILIQKCKLNKTQLIEAPEGTSWRLSYSGSLQTKRILDYLYKGSTVYLDRKYQHYYNVFPVKTKKQIIEENWDNFIKRLWGDNFNYINVHNFLRDVG